MNLTPTIAVLLLQVFGPALSNRTFTVVKFQNDTDRADDTFLDAGIGALPDITRFTFCTRFWITMHGKSITIFFSYLPSHEVLDFYIGYKVYLGAFHLSIMDLGLFEEDAFEFQIPVHRFKWHSFCLLLAIEKTVVNASIVLDGKVHQMTKVIQRVDVRKITGGGRLIIGQELDSISGSLSRSQIFIGKLADTFISNESIGLEKAISYTNCNSWSTNFTTLYDFNKNFDKLRQVGHLEVNSVGVSQICYDKGSLLIPFLMTFKESLEVCNSLNESLFLADSNREHEQISSRYRHQNALCYGTYSTSYWIGLVGDLNSKKWLSISDGKEMAYHNFDSSYSSVTDQFSCVSSGLVYNSLWYGTRCSELACPLCTFSRITTLRILGLCEKTMFERKLYLGGIENMKLKFYGWYFTKLFYTEDETWKITSNLGNFSLSKADTAGSILPTGRSNWTSEGDECSTKEVNLVLTICNEHQWTCTNGDCISRENRCNSVIDCSDSSDEVDCSKYILSKGYRKHQSPPPVEGTFFHMNFSVRILNVRTIELSTFTMILDVIETVQWKDSRVNFAHLHNRESIIRKPEALWLPSFDVEDGTESPVSSDRKLQTLTITRESRPMETNEFHNKEDQLYPGSKNTLTLRRTMNIKLSCRFHLRPYPFDRQRCQLFLEISGVKKNVKIRKDGAGITYTGIRSLLEYYIAEESMEIEDHSSVSNASVIKITLTVTNQFNYYISNTFVPSLLLLFVCYFVFYFDIEDFSDRVMVSLTSLLVLVSLFSQTTDYIPRTSYMKLIDVWFMTLIILDFCVILILVVIEYQRLQESKDSKSVPIGQISLGFPSKVRPSGSVPEKSNSTEFYEKLNFWSKIFFPTVYSVLITTFVAFAIVSKNSEF